MVSGLYDARISALCLSGGVARPIIFPLSLAWSSIPLPLQTFCRISRSRRFPSIDFMYMDASVTEFELIREDIFIVCRRVSAQGRGLVFALGESMC